MKRLILLFFILLSTSLPLKEAFAGDPFYYDQRTRLVNTCTEILMSHGLCADKNDCIKKQFVFVGGSSGGIYLEVYGVTEMPVISKVISASVSEYAKNNKKISVTVYFYNEKHNDVEGIIGAIFSSPFAQLNLGGE